jgi:hypothetical protein
VLKIKDLRTLRFELVLNTQTRLIIAIVPAVRRRKKRRISYGSGWIVTFSMQGKKDYQENVAHFQLERPYPRETLYLHCKRGADLGFLCCISTKATMGRSGKEHRFPSCSSSPVIAIWRRRHQWIANHRPLFTLDILFYRLWYRWGTRHNTISRTRQLFPESVSKKYLLKVLAIMCRQRYSVRLSIRRSVLKLSPDDSLSWVKFRLIWVHLHRVRHISEMDKKKNLIRRSKNNRAPLKVNKVSPWRS